MSGFEQIRLKSVKDIKLDFIFNNLEKVRRTHCQLEIVLYERKLQELEHEI
jgi:hypothetical protein